jgi:hypothetical protein
MRIVKVILAGLLSVAAFEPATVPAQSTPVTLAWSPSPDSLVVGYNLYYGEVASTQTNKLDVGPALGATVSNLQAGVNYYFFATAYDASTIESEPSNFNTHAPAPVTYPDLVIRSVNYIPDSPAAGEAVSFSAVIANEGTAALPDGLGVRVSFSINGAPAVAWTSLANALLPGQSATVSPSAGAWTAIAGIHTLTATVDDLDVLSESNEANNLFQTTLPVSATPPPTNNSTQSVTLAWSPSPDNTVVGYNLYYGEVVGTLTNKLNAGPALTATVTNLSAGVTYFFFATAYDASGVESEPSNFITNTVGAVTTPLVSLALDQTTVAEGDARGAVVVIQRSGGSAGDLSVGLQFSGSAANGLDYLPVPGTIVIPAETNSVALRLIPIANGVADGGRIATLNLVPHASYQIQSPGSDTLLIADQDSDSDGDGMSDAAELLAGTDASDPESSL